MGGCKVLVLANAHEQLDGLRPTERDFIVRRMTHFAAEPGHPLDGIRPMKRLTLVVNPIRKLTVGRHRLFFTGKGSECTYRLAWVKVYKRSGVDNEDDPSFQRKLIQALARPATGILPPP